VDTLTLLQLSEINLSHLRDYVGMILFLLIVNDVLALVALVFIYTGIKSNTDRSTRKLIEAVEAVEDAVKELRARRP
jgi:hypothetical protein